MKEILQQLFKQKYLSKEKAKEVLGQISDGLYNVNQISAFLTVFKMRNITVNELVGFRECIRERCLSIDLSDFDPIDLCGTGGDGKDTFNVSTLASFVVAGAGYKVAKHGNYGVSSVCGSSNVMEKLGYKFSNEETKLRKQLDRTGITFLHAPLFHPAMKEVAPIRKDLGIPTFFNMLGPMVNPSFPRKQLVGVFSLQLQRYYKYIYEQEDLSYRIVHSLDGYDEISLTNKVKVVSPEKEYILEAKQIDSVNLNPQELLGGRTIDDAVNIFTNILQGNGTSAQNTVVCANAAMAIQCYKPDQSYKDCFSEAQESLYSNRAYQTLQKLLSI